MGHCASRLGGSVDRLRLVQRQVNLPGSGEVLGCSVLVRGSMSLARALHVLHWARGLEGSQDCYSYFLSVCGLKGPQMDFLAVVRRRSSCQNRVEINGIKCRDVPAPAVCASRRERSLSCLGLVAVLVVFAFELPGETRNVV